MIAFNDDDVVDDYDGCWISDRDGGRPHMREKGPPQCRTMLGSGPGPMSLMGPHRQRQNAEKSQVGDLI